MKFDPAKVLQYKAVQRPRKDGVGFTIIFTQYTHAENVPKRVFPRSRNDSCWVRTGVKR